MIIFYATDIIENHIKLLGDEHHHCTKVLRNQAGAQISVTDGKGHMFLAEIEQTNKLETLCRIIEINSQPLPERLPSIAISLLKNPARLEWFVEKAVEIGIGEIILFQSGRTEKKSVNIERIEKLMIAAMKQSLNLYLPQCTILKCFEDLISESHKFTGKYIAWCGTDTIHLQDIRHKNESNILLIGPEGDFTKEETDIAVHNGFQLVSLGSTRLRTETAGVVGLTMMHY